MNVNKLLAVVLISLFLSVFSVSAHDSHVHTAPWQACEEKKKSEQCSYTNGEHDLFKGSCQLFSEVLMCVRNQPIIHVEVLTTDTEKNTKVKDISDLSFSH
jgi:hypothetical protein